MVAFLKLASLVCGALQQPNIQCSNSSAFLQGGTSVTKYKMVSLPTASACCAACADDAQNCGHWVFVPSEQNDGDCKLKKGSAKLIGGLGTCGGAITPGPKPKQPTPPPKPSPSPPVPTPPPQPPAKGAPNILILFPDQWRFDWDSYHSDPTGEIPLRLPVTRSVAERGVRFLQAYVPAPVCAPSRSCLASGREYDFTGVPSNGHDYPINQTTFYAVLRSAGYHTMTTGKDDLTKASQLGSKNGYPGCPQCKPGDGLYHQAELGFSDALRYSGKMDVVQQRTPHEMYGYFLLNQSVTTEEGQKTNAWEAHRACMHRKSGGSHLVVNGVKVDASDLCDKLTYTADVYEDDFTASNAITLLRRRPKDKPFFLHVSFPGPHDPFLVTAAMRDSASDGRAWPLATDDPEGNTPGGACNATGEPDGTRKRCNYAAEIENLDKLFKRVLDEVEAQGVLDNTLVCITSDHGEMLGDHGDVDKSKPWEGSAHVPLMCAGPGVGKNMTHRAPVGTMDMAGTFMDFAGIAPAPGMTTKSWRSLLEKPDNGKMVRTDSQAGDPVYRDFISSGLANFRMVVQVHNDTTYKYICCNGQCPNPPSSAPKVDKSGWMQMLIAPETDPFDMKDLAPAMPDIVSSMRALLPPDYAAGCAKINVRSFSLEM